MKNNQWQVFNPSGSRRVIVTKALPGQRWIDILTAADCRIEVCKSEQVLSVEQIQEAIGERCDGAIGQLTETWEEALFEALQKARAKVYSNYAVGFNNIDLAAAVKCGIPVGNTPGVLTETTAEMAVALTFAAARRVCESEQFLRKGRFQGWLPTLFLGELLWRKTLGVIGLGRIGAAYARMMMEGHKMNLLYYDLHPNPDMQNYAASYGAFLESQNQAPVTCKRVETVEDLLAEADCVSIHTVLDDGTHHLINAKRLALMKSNAILINTSRGPVIDEAALVSHCRKNPDFKAGLDVFEHEPDMAPGLAELSNVVIVPHIASATQWTRTGMAILAASNVAAILQDFPVWKDSNISPFLREDAPRAAPSILNAEELEMAFIS